MAGTGVAEVGLIEYGWLDVDVAAGDVTLSEAQAKNGFLRIWGTIPANRTVTVPNTRAIPRFVHNDTSGAFTVTVKTPAGTGVVIGQGERTVVHSDGTNIVASQTDLANATHTHQSAGEGGTLNTAAITAGTLDAARLPNAEVAARGAVLMAAARADLGALTAATPDALTTVETADGTYDATEQAMLNNILTDITELRTELAAAVADLGTIRTAFNDLLAKIRTAGTLAT